MTKRAEPPAKDVGADVGASLVKLAVQRDGGEPELLLLPRGPGDEALRQRLEALAPRRLALTGGGAGALAEELSDAHLFVEFAAWGAGAKRLLGPAGRTVGERYLLVSLGTGTSAMLVAGADVERLGGTALGGGTVVGLGAALTGTARFDELVELAGGGDRRRVDLLVSDVYPPAQLEHLERLGLPGDLNAASFAKLARLAPGVAADRRDLAHAVMGMVGENVALICGALAAGAGVSRLVFGGATLRGNEVLRQALAAASRYLGMEAVFLPRGEFAGALGALDLLLAEGG